MKKIIYSLFAVVTMFCAVECTAQTDFWAWKNGQYTKFEKADSITFVDSVANPIVADSNLIDGHDYVDLGLLSGTLWATCNVGAKKPEEYGDYFAWGETTPKESYTWSTYKWCNGSEITLTKYCVDNNYSAVDSLTTLLAEDDAATANWGSSWRMPTKAELDELVDGCNWEWTNNFNGSGVAGHIGTSKTNRNTIFLPAAGIRNGTYWSSSLREYDPSFAYGLDLSAEIIGWKNVHRSLGYCVRAVVK